ncbi:MAG: outer membrane beta-barrel protein [Proteobacteria bacterium]|nr:outer membrane beta-barrel protein [Pseudomonadota bacterium]
MNKKVIYSMALTAFLATSAAFAGGAEVVAVQNVNPFNGFYVGGNLDFHHTGFDINGSTDLYNSIVPPNVKPFTAELSSQNGGDRSNNLYVGPQIGWGKVFQNRWYGGLEGFADFGHANGSVSTSSVQANDFVKVTNSAQVGDNYGVASKLGVLLTPTTLAYAKLGVSWAQIKTSVSFDTLYKTASNSNRDMKPGFVWGVGAEQFVWKDLVSLYGEYTYESFGSVSTSATMPIAETIAGKADLTVNASSKANVSAFTGGVNFHFLNNWF